MYLVDGTQLTPVPGHEGLVTDGNGDFWQVSSPEYPEPGYVASSEMVGITDDGGFVQLEGTDGPPQSDAAQATEGDLGGPDGFDYGTWTGTGLNADDQAAEEPYPSLDAEGSDMDGFAAQWDQVITTFDPLYRALAEASAALSELLAFEWEGDAGEQTREAARKLKTAIDALLAVGSENGLADLLNTAHAQRADWQGKSDDFSQLELINTLLFVGGFVLAFIPIPVAGLVGGIGRAVTTAIRAIPGLTRAGGAIGGAIGRILPSTVTRGIGAVSTSRTGSIVFETGVIGGVEYTLAFSVESIYRKALYEAYGLDPNYGEGALLALGAPIGATVWLSRLPRSLDRAFEANPVLRDIGLGALSGLGAPAGFAIAFGEVEDILWAGLAAGGLAGAIGSSTRRFDQRWNQGRTSAAWREKMRAELERENIPGFTNELFAGMIPAGFGSSLRNTQGRAAPHLSSARSVEARTTAAQSTAAEARQKHWTADELSNEATRLRQQAAGLERTDPDGAAVLITQARGLDTRAAATRDEARALNGTDDSTQAGQAYQTADVAGRDATLRRQVWEVIDKKGVDYFYALVAQSRRLGYVFEAAYQIPISLGSKVWLKVLVTMELDATPAELLGAQAAEEFEALYGEVPDIDPALLEEAGLPVDTPVDTTPVDTTPVDTTPVDTTPVDTTPVDTTPVDTEQPVGPGGEGDLVEVQTDLRAVGVDLTALADRVNSLLASAEGDAVLTTIQKASLTDLRERLTALQAEVTGAQGDLSAGRPVTVGAVSGFVARSDGLRAEVDALAADLVPA